VGPGAVLRRLVVSPQRAGISSARAAIFFPPGFVPRGDQMLAELGVGADRRLSAHYLDLDSTPFAPPPTHAVPRIFCATRLTWKEEPGSGLTSLDYKGSHLMLEGLALHLRRSGAPLDIHLVRKGRHVAETAALAERLGLSPHLTWHEEMGQLEILEHFRRADIVFEQLAQSVVGMAGLDALATGRPVIANGRPEILEPFLGAPSPICQARTAEEVCRHLGALGASPETRARLGREGRAYVERYFSADRVARDLVARMTTPAKRS
jgi:glycosyltransferase involved in cell wall biosynthesis